MEQLMKVYGGVCGVAVGTVEELVVFCDLVLGCGRVLGGFLATGLMGLMTVSRGLTIGWGLTGGERDL